MKAPNLYDDLTARMRGQRGGPARGQDRDEVKRLFLMWLYSAEPPCLAELRQDGVVGSMDGDLGATGAAEPDDTWTPMAGWCRIAVESYAAPARRAMVFTNCGGGAGFTIHPPRAGGVSVEDAVRLRDWLNIHYPEK